MLGTLALTDILKKFLFLQLMIRSHLPPNFTIPHCATRNCEMSALGISLN